MPPHFFFTFPTGAASAVSFLEVCFLPVVPQACMIFTRYKGQLLFHGLCWAPTCYYICLFIYGISLRTELSKQQDMARAEVGMSVLAQAAGLLDIEGSAEEESNDNSSSLSGGDSSGGYGGETRRNAPKNTHGMVDCRSSFGSSHGSSAHPYGRVHNHHHLNHLNHLNHNGSVPDHGSTPPGSATPPPCGGAASGGVMAAGEAPPFGGGVNGNVNAEARAFAVGAHETTRMNTQGYGGGGGGGGKSSYGEEGGGGDRVTPQWAVSPALSSAQGAPAPSSSSSSSSQRPGWFVGPGGVQRRSLQSVPGPWRPYWRGEDGSNKDSAAAAAAASAAAESGGVTTKR